MAKFQLGQTVKYIGRNGLFSPLKGDIGVVLKKNYWETEYLVSFPWVKVPKPMDCRTDMNFWYSEHELAPATEKEVQEQAEKIAKSLL